MSEPLRLLSIAATGQAGSTILSRLLGARLGVISVGEIGFIWDRALLEDVPCSCQQPFRECPFWREVGERAFGGWGTIDADAMVALRNEMNFLGRSFPQWTVLPVIAVPSLSPQYRRTVDRYASVMARLYRGIADVSAARIIVDSMKQPPHVFMLRRIAGADIRWIHLVRDSRGVAYSNMKWVRRQGADPDAFRPRHPPQKTSFRWDWINLAFGSLARSDRPLLRVRYEDLVSETEEQLMRVEGWLAAGPDGASWDLAQRVSGSRAEHLVAGNRVRLQSPDAPLRLDTEWHEKLSSRDRWVVTSMTWPLLLRYGYELRDIH